MKKNLLLLLLVTIGSFIQAQHVCGTHEPTTSEIQYIQNEIATKIIPKNNGTTCIPIQAHVVRETNGSGGISLADMHAGVAFLNEYYKPAGIEFYFCGTGPNYVDNSTLYDFKSADENLLAATAGENNNAINIYFVDGIDYAGGPSFTAGYAYTPSNSVQSTRIVLRNGSVASGLTIIHEMGHHYALLHTFRGTIDGNTDPDAENVPRVGANANCLTDGDLLCDTPADPGYTGANVDANCNYTGTNTDINGVTYAPSIDNVMSYFPEFCQTPTVLTSDQILRIQQGLITRQGHSSYDMSCPATNVTDPSNFTATLSGSTVNLTWSDNSSNEFGFFIERSSTSATAGFEAFGGFGVGANVTTFTDNASLTPGTTYYYRVKASNDGCNDYSNVDSVTATYCAANGITCDEYIGRVQLNTIDNSTACSAGGYADHTAISTDLTLGTAYTATITNGNPSNNDRCGVWIDWNQDDDFYDAGESFTVTGGAAVFTANFTVPVGALTGPTTMRTRIHWTNEATDPCGSTVWGEVEDYSINVISSSPCSIASITAGTQTACVPATNTYTQELIITYVNAPTGTIEVNGQIFPVASSPQTIVLTNLTADGNAVDVTAFFTNEVTCNLAETALFTAPVNCTPTPCAIASITAGTQTSCVPATNTYTQELIINYVNAPTGTIEVNAQIFPVASSPQTIVLTNLTADGNAVDVTAFFTNDITCNFTETSAFTAPASCTLSPCSITAISSGTQTACVPATNTYTQEVTITYANAPTGTIDVNGQTFAVSSSPQTVILTNLTADGIAVDVTAFFTNDAACTFTQNAAFTAPVGCAAANCTVGDVDPALDGGVFNYCPGSILDLLTDGNEVVPVGEDYVWVFINTTDTLYINTGGSYSGDINAALTTPIPDGTYTVYAFVTENAGTAICDFTPGDFTVNVLAAANPLCACNPGDVDPALDGGVFDYCPGTDVDLLTDGNQVIPAGEDYVWVFLNATDTIAVTTGGDYVGDINAALTTPIPFGTYTVFAYVTENGGTAICGTTLGDFTINVLQTSDPACSATCGITAISAGTQTACVPASNTYTQEVTITYANAPTGTLDVNGQTFAVTTSPQTITLTNLTADGNAVDVTAFFTNDVACTFTETAAFTAPVNCTPPPCSIASISAGTQTACVPATNTYTQEVTITYTNAPTGTLDVNGQTFAVSSSPQTVTLTNLVANGIATDVTAFFTNTPACTFTETAAFTAPVSCTLTPCSISSITAGTQTACVAASNTYTQEVTITYANAPMATTIDVNGQTFIINSSPQTVTLTNLTADGNAVDVTAFFTSDPTCNLTETALFTAPLNCTPPPCAIASITAGTQTACMPATNTYTQELIITYVNAPTGTIEVNGEIFAVTTSPQTVVLTNLTSDGNAVDVTAFFTNDITCNLAETALFTAPANCTPPCGITTITAGTQTACVPGTNTYTQEVTITYANAPSGTIEVNGQTFTVGTSPQTVVLTNLTADGVAVDVTVFFTNDVSCTLTENAAFIAPVSCAAPNCTVGDVDPLIDGGVFDYCPGSILNLLTDGNEVVPAGESYVWVFINATDTVFVNTGGPYSGDINAALATPIPDGTYTVFALVTENAGTAICATTPGDFTVNVLAAADPLCACNAGDVDPTLDGLTFNYCPGTTVDLLTDGNEIIPVGEDYFWSFLNATDTLFINTGGSYSGDINDDLVTAGATPIPFGTYTVSALVTESGGTAICATTPGSFTVNVLEASDPACLAPCNITALSFGTQSVCSPGTNTYTQQVTITYVNAPTGTIEVNGQTFAVGTSPQTVTLTNLTANGNTVNVTAFFTNDAACTFTQNAAFTAPVSCAPPACGITNLTVGTQSTCDSTTNTFTQEVTLTYANAPTGTINVNGQTFAVGASPQTVTLTNLTANGNLIDVFAFFTNATSCNYTLSGAFTAPINCSVTGPTDTLVVMMFPSGSGTLFVENDIITTTPYIGVYPSNSTININATVNGNNVFDFWKLNNLSFPDYSPSTSFAFINQDTLFAYFNGYVGIADVSDEFSNFSLYPTIINDGFMVEFESKENINLSIDVFSIDGKMISNVFAEEIQADTQYKERLSFEAASGIYFIKVSSDEASFVYKVIKE